MTEIKSGIKTLPAKPRSGLDGFAAEFYQTFEAELTPNLLKLLETIGKQ